MSETCATNLLVLLDQWRRNSADRPAIVEYDVYASRRSGKPVVRNSVTARELWDTTIAVAVSLRRSGIGPGDVVAVQLPNWHEYMAAHLAAYAIGAVTVLISPIYRTRDVARQLVLSKAVALLVPASHGSFDYVEMAQSLERDNPSLRVVVAVGEGDARGAVKWSDMVAAGKADDLAAERQAVGEGRFAPALNDHMLLNFTSGTTGEPKGVMHSTATVSATVSGTLKRLGLTRDDVLFTAVTLGHAGGFLNGIYMPLLLGAKAVYMDLWDSTVALHVLETEGVTYGPMMPPYLFDFANHPSFANTNLARWRIARVSGGAISRSLMASLQQQLPNLRLCPGWGLSEAFIVTCGSPDDPLEKRNRTEGQPLDGYRVQIRDSTLTRELPIGQTGEIVVSGPSLMLGYFHQEALTRAAFSPDGWLKTGDLGFSDAEGFLTMVGRSKDLIIRGGENVPVVEVEQLLMEHPKVAAAVLVGVPDTRLGEKVCAVIQCKNKSDPLDLEEMKSFLIGRQLTKQFIPEYLVLRDELPKTAIGKVKKQELGKQVRDELAQLTA